MKTETQKIVSLLKRTFEKGAWHGPSVKEVLQSITADDARSKLSNSHSIIELVAHMTAWRNFVTRKLEGDQDYKVTEELNFPAATEWLKVIEDLEESQGKLLAAVEQFPVEKLSELVPHSTHQYTFYTLLHGIIHHDLYHAGQIKLIQKATAKQSL